LLGRHISPSCMDDVRDFNNSSAMSQSVGVRR
jgi:hypothetical protein